MKIERVWHTPILWEPSNPYLYTLEIKFCINSSINNTDWRVYCQRFGFREFWIDGKKFILNGIPIHLLGTNMICGRYFLAHRYDYILEQERGNEFSWLPSAFVVSRQHVPGRWAHIIAPNHPVFDGIPTTRLSNWEEGVVATCLWKPIKFPARGNFKILVDCGFTTSKEMGKPYVSVNKAALVEMFEGKGRIVISSLRLIKNFNEEPTAARLLANIISYLSINPRNFFHRKVLAIDGDAAVLLKTLGAKYSFCKVLPNKLQKDTILLAVGNFPSSKTTNLPNFIKNGGILCVFNLSPGLYNKLGVTFTIRRKVKVRYMDKSAAEPVYYVPVIEHKTRCELWSGITTTDLRMALKNKSVSWIDTDIKEDILAYWRLMPLEPCYYVPPTLPKYLEDSTRNAPILPLSVKFAIGKGKLFLVQIPGTASFNELANRFIVSTLLTNLGVTMKSNPLKNYSGKMKVNCIRAGKVYIDRDLNEWTYSNPIGMEPWVHASPIVITSNMLSDPKDRTISSNLDLSAVAYTMWDTQYLYVAAMVIDDKVILMDNGCSVYKSDSIEFWLNDVQIGVTQSKNKNPNISMTIAGSKHCSPKGINLLSGDGKNLGIG